MNSNIWHTKQKPISSLSSIGGGAGGIMFGVSDDYEIERSLRFNDDDSPYLSRTPSGAGNKKTFTWSGWAKRSSFARGVLFGTGTSLGSQEAGIEFDGLVIRCYSYTGSFVFNVTTSANYRDPTAWMHIVFSLDTTQSTSSERARLYVNGERVTALATDTQPSQNVDVAHFNATQEHRIGQLMGSHKFDGYLADVHFVDGTRLDASSFGKTNADTGQWVAKKYGGSYGTNGFHLKFADNSGTTATTLGKDSSGNGNNYTPNNFSVTAGETDDSFTDTPFENFCTLNTIQPATKTAGTVSNGALDVAGADYVLQRATWHFGPGGITSGKWMWEVKNTSSSGATQYGMYTGITANFEQSGGEIASTTDKSWASTSAFGYKNYTATSTTEPGAGNQSLGTMTFALDLDAQTLKYYFNGSLFNTDSTIPDPAVTEFAPFVFSTNSGGADWANHHFNFGQRAFSHAQTGYNALSTANMSITIDKSIDHFGTSLWTGNGGTSQTISGLEFQPDFIWIKGRSNAAWHRLQNTVTGINKLMYTNSEAAEATDEANGYVSSVTSDGYVLADPGGNGGGVNQSGETYVGWAWKGSGSTSSNSSGTITSTVDVNATAGFSIGSYTGTGSAATIGHGLGVKPEVIIIKNRTDSSSSYWSVYHHNSFVSAADPNMIYLNDTNGKRDDTNVLGTSVTINSTVFSVGDYNGSNGNGDNMVFYCFSGIPGYSKFGTYEGINNADGPYVHLGFRPEFLLIKNIDSDARPWILKTSKIPGYNPNPNWVQTNSNAAEATNEYTDIDFLSNGFKLRQNGSYTNNTVSYIYLAFAAFPSKYANAF